MKFVIVWGKGGKGGGERIQNLGREIPPPKALKKKNTGQHFPMAVAKARHLITDTADLYHNCFAMVAMETYGSFFDTHTILYIQETAVFENV